MGYIASKTTQDVQGSYCNGDSGFPREVSNDHRKDGLTTSRIGRTTQDTKWRKQMEAYAQEWMSKGC